MRKTFFFILIILLSAFTVACSSDTDEADDQSNETSSEAIDDEETIELSDEEKEFFEEIEKMEEEFLEAEENPQTLKGFKEGYQNAGYEVSETEKVDYERLYADDGIKFEVDGQVIEIYKYNSANEIPEEAELIIFYPEENPVMFDNSDTVADTTYNDTYMGIYDVPGFLLVHDLAYEGPKHPTEPDRQPPVSVLSVFMEYSLTSNSAP